MTPEQTILTVVLALLALAATVLQQMSVDECIRYGYPLGARIRFWVATALAIVLIVSTVWVASS